MGMRKLLFLCCIVSMLAACSKDDELEYRDLLGVWVSQRDFYISALEVINDARCNIWVNSDGQYYYYECRYHLDGNDMYFQIQSIDNLEFSATILDYNSESITCRWKYQKNTTTLQMKRADSVPFKQ